MNDITIDGFYEMAEKNKELFRDIFVSPPVRPHDGLAPQLACMLSAWLQAGIMWSPLDSGMAGFIEVTRMKIAHDFLHNRTQKYLLMIDNDTEPPLELPYLLARHEEAVVGACIPSMNVRGRRMLCFTRNDAAGTPRFIDFDCGKKIPATGLAEVPHIGTGALMIRRDVLESFTYKQGPACDSCGAGDWDVPFLVPDHVKARGMVYGRLMEGEDIRFCKQVRAKGYKIHVDLEAHCGHRKSMRLGFPPELRDPSMRIEDWKAPVEGSALRRV